MNDDICKALTDLNVKTDLLKRYNHLSVRRRKLESAIILDLWALCVCVLTLIDLEVKRLVHKLNLLL